jgi:hypothetical protein
MRIGPILRHMGLKKGHAALLEKEARVVCGGQAARRRRERAARALLAQRRRTKRRCFSICQIFVGVGGGGARSAGTARMQWEGGSRPAAQPPSPAGGVRPASGAYKTRQGKDAISA